jgi:hypothetical protein
VIATPEEHTANILLDMIDDKLTIPMKCQGYLDMCNGIDAAQTWDYIEFSSKLLIEMICKKYLVSWMQNFTSTNDQPTPLPTDPTWFKSSMQSLVILTPTCSSNLPRKFN